MRAVAKLLIGIGTLGLSVGLSYIYTIYTPVLADSLKSSHYVFQETALGGTGLISSQSAHFQAMGTSGVLGQGTSVGSAFQFEGGNVTTGDPALTFAVNSESVNFGTFSAAAASTTTLTFQVSDYTSYGYVVQTLGTPPTNGTHTIAAMGTTGPSQAGVEQFGINLVANTSPVSLGSNPDHGQFGFGSAAANYDTPNNYRFVSGETIASAPKSSGLTIYTVSYILNVSSLTPGGQYSGNQTILCTGTY